MGNIDNDTLTAYINNRDSYLTTENYISNRIYLISDLISGHRRGFYIDSVCNHGQQVINFVSNTFSLGRYSSSRKTKWIDPVTNEVWELDVQMPVLWLYLSEAELTKVINDGFNLMIEHDKVQRAEKRHVSAAQRKARADLKAKALSKLTDEEKIVLNCMSNKKGAAKNGTRRR